MLCLQKGGIKRGDLTPLDEAISRIATNEMQQYQQKFGQGQTHKLRIRAFLAESDEVIGRGDQRYLESCFASAAFADSLDFHCEILPGTDHDDVLTKGVFGKVMQEICNSMAEEELIILAEMFRSPLEMIVEQ